MIWTPSILPPHPSTISSLSPLAQNVLALIKQEGEGGGNSLRETYYRASVSGSSYDRHQNSVSTNVQHQTGREGLSGATDGLFDFQISSGMNSLTDVTEHHSQSVGNRMSISNTHTFPSTSYIPANLGRTPFNVPPWMNTNVQQRKQYSRSIYPQTQPSQSLVEPVGRGNQMQSYNSPFEPIVEIRENNTGINRPYNLSPDMEFDDMEVYSCPFNKPEEENIKILNRNKNPVAATNSLNFKEIKPRPLQKGGLQINTPLPLLRPAGDANRILTSNKMEPSDQTFVFKNANTVPKFKRTLTKFKNTSSGKPDLKKPLIQKVNDDKDIFPGNLETKSHHRKRTFNVTRTERGYQKLLDDIRAEKENFEVDDVFDEGFENAVSKVGQEDKDVKSMMGNTQKIEMNFKRTKSVEDPSTCLSKKSEGLMPEIQENKNPQCSTKQREGQDIMYFSTNDSNFNNQLDLSENLFVKTQENQFFDNYDCAQIRVNKVDEQNQSKVLNSPTYQQNVINFTSQQSDLSQNLFVKTQESVIAFKHDYPQNRVNEIDEKNQSEELSLPPYQKPFETNDSPDFEVEDLFSLKDESLKESLAALKRKFDNVEYTKTPKFGGDGEGKGLSISNSRIENFNLNVTNLTKSEEEMKLIENSSQIDDNQMKQKTDGEHSVNKYIRSNNSYNVLPVKSTYFQASNQKENSKLGFQRMSMNGNKMNIGTGNLESPGQVKDKVTTISVETAGVGIPRKNLMEVDIEIERGNVVTKSCSKKTSLKQSTLFDCRKFQPEIKSSGDFHDAETKSITQPVEVPLQVEKFKKPLPPAKKARTVKPSPKNVKKSDKSLSPINLDNQSCSKSNSNGKDFLQSNTPMKEIRQRCDPSKLVQTSLIKSEPVKRSVPSASKPKNSKKPLFVPPIAASHLTSQETELKDYTITVIDEVSANEVLRRLDSEELTKVVTTVAFKEGYTLLNKPEDQKKNSRCFPSGVMFMILWGTGRFGYYWLSLLDLSSVTPPVIKLVDTLMSKSERNICFEAQAVYMLLMDVLKYKDISNWHAYDPLIGSWLLDPDNPPKDFQETTAKLQMDRNLLVVNPQANTKNQACDLLPVLDVAMNILQNRLVNASLWTVFSDMETKLIPILAVMESSSILVDVEKLHRTAEAMDKKLRMLQSEAHTLADRWFQLNSPQQLREILFDKLKLDEKFNLKIKKTEHGVKSTSETVLEQMKDYHPLPKIILEYRHLQKLKSTYVDGLIQHVRSDGTVGTSWEQVAAATGRITSKNPNLQAFPKRPITVKGGETIHLREMFKAREGCTFLAADFQQIEFRVFAHFTQDKTLLQAFGEGGDIFRRLAERWLGGKGDEEREKTKRIVYSVMYGAGAAKLSEYLHVEPSEAYKIIDNFVAIFPSLRSLPRTVIAQCRAQGFVVTLSGRRRLFPHIRSTNGKLRSYSERQAMNFLIQGSAADICKAAMLDCEAEIRSRGLRAKLLLMIHDELVWEVDERDLHETAKTVREAMEHRWNDRLTLLVPIPVSISSGKTLADMQSLAERDDSSEQH